VRYCIEHETQLSFGSPVREHHCELRLTPHHNAAQQLERVEIDVEPRAELHSYSDYFGNRVHYFGVVAPHDALHTRVRATVTTMLDNPFDYPPVPPVHERQWIERTLRVQPRLWDFVLHHSAAVPDLTQGAPADLTLPAYDPQAPLLDSVCRARDWIAETFTYRTGVTHVHSSLSEVFESRAGVCQDFAHLLIAAVRAWGVPARYVMGYQAGGSPADGGTPHAWAEVLIPGAGWRGFDPTARLVADATYVTVAVGRDYLDAAPQRGSFKGDVEQAPPAVELRLQPVPQ
jgi:transglutaminase-like putative cysteine protease